MWEIVYLCSSAQKKFDTKHPVWWWWRRRQWWWMKRNVPFAACTYIHPCIDNQLGFDLIFVLSFRALITCHIFRKTETASGAEYRILALSVKWFCSFVPPFVRSFIHSFNKLSFFFHTASHSIPSQTECS